MGVWIEIYCGTTDGDLYRFTPVWGCGLKYDDNAYTDVNGNVHPRVGVWIEIR